MTRQRKASTSTTALFLLLMLCASLAWSSAFAHEVGHAAPAAAAPQDSEVRTLIMAFRETGDDRHLDAAWDRLQPMLAIEPDASVLVDAATVAQARHDFHSAIELIDRALLMQPGYDQAWLLRASIHLVQGEIRKAEDACRQLQSVPLLVAVTCNARVAIVKGQHSRALDVLSATIEAVDMEIANPELMAWVFSTAGDAAAPRDAEKAASFYQQSLELAESVQVRAALADVLLRADRFDKAGAVLNAGHRALPLHVRRLVLAVRTGQSDALAEEIARTDHEFRHWIAREDWAHAREMTRFYIDVVDRPGLARRLALINLDLQKEPEDLLLAARSGRCSSCGP